MENSIWYTALRYTGMGTPQDKDFAAAGEEREETETGGKDDQRKTKGIYLHKDYYTLSTV